MKNRRLRLAVRGGWASRLPPPRRFYELTVERYRRAQRACDCAPSRGERQTRGIDSSVVRCRKTTEVGAATGERARTIDDRVRAPGLVALAREGDTQEL